MFYKVLSDISMYVTTIQIYETVIVNRQQTSTGLGLRQFLE